MSFVNSNIFMGKTSASIKLIQILSANNDFVSADDLAIMLDTNKRNIREYVAEVEEAGYIIESKRGVTGGYRMLSKSTLPSPKLTKEETKAIKDSYEFLRDHDYELLDDFSNATQKFLSSKDEDANELSKYIFEKYPLSMDKKNLMDRYQTLSQAIEDQYQCDITYNSVNNKLQQHTIQPYKLFYYNGGWFVLAYEPIKNDFVYFKLNRMVQVYKTKTHFTKMDFDLDDYLDEFGLKKNGDYYPVELAFNGINIYIEERTYGKNQQLEIVDDNNIILRCEMQNKDMIKSFVLSFGSRCKVLSPDWLKESVQEELLKLMDIYD